MPLEKISKADFKMHIQLAEQKSFMQSLEMAELLSKRGYQVAYLGFKDQGQLQVAAILFSLPMTGGLHMEINSGPVSRDKRYLKAF